jgi:hypothetical protein
MRSRLPVRRVASTQTYLSCVVIKTGQNMASHEKIRPPTLGSWDALAQLPAEIGARA